MASKSGRKNLNNHKSRSYKGDYRGSFTPKKIQKSRGGDFVYVALDTNIIFRIIDYTEGREYVSKYAAEEARKDVNFLFSNCAYNPDGSRNPFGKLVYVVLPEVLDELKKNLKYCGLREEIANLVEKTMLVLTPDFDMEKRYSRLIEPLMQELEKNEMMLRNGKRSNDMKIWARAAFLNLTLITNDNDFKVETKEPLKKIRAISLKKLPGDHTGHIAAPISLSDFKSQFANRKTFSQPENTEYLNCISRKAITDKNPPEKVVKKEIEFVR